MRLSTRLFVVALLCLLPVVVALSYIQPVPRAHRPGALDSAALRSAVLGQAMVAAEATASVIRGVGDLAAALAPLAEPGANPDACHTQFTGLLAELSKFRFLGLYDREGTLLCGSKGAPAQWTGNDMGWFRQLAATNHAEAGILGSDIAGRPTLPVGGPVGLERQDGGRPVLVAGLDPAWLHAYLADSQRPASDGTMAPRILVADQMGSVVATLGGPPRATLPAWLRPVLAAPAAGATEQTAPDGEAMMVAGVPAAPAEARLPVIATLPMAWLASASSPTAQRETAIYLGAIVVALVLAWMAGNRLIRRPVLGLMQADRSWREGDLTARARTSGRRSEFTTLAHSFNTMADAVQARDAESQRQATALEARVEERTKALSESNNRLQVEIAGRERTAAALHQAQKLQAVGQLAGGIAHDFNNVLATVLGNLELIERRLIQVDKPWGDSDRERLTRLVDRASSAVHRGSRLTSRLLAFSRRQQISPTPTDINALLRDVVTLATSALGSRVKVVSELEDALWPAMVDPSQVEAAVLNLCFNARDALPEGGTVTIRTENAVVEEGQDLQLAAGDYIAISVSDTGKGMTPEVKARAFEPFFSTKGLVGTGLGLSQVYGMARQVGGDATIRSRLGEGTTVTLYVPRSQSADNDNVNSAIPVEEASKAGCGEHALVVDDDRDVRQVTVEMLRDLGFEVAEASDGEQALALIATLPRQPDLILLDYAMPAMNGLRLAEEMRRRGVTAPIGLVTGYAELSGADLTAARFFGVLQKPFTIQGLQGLVAQRRRAMDTMQADAMPHLL